MGAEGSGDVRLELERLRGEVTTGFARVEGQLALIAQGQVDQRKDLDDLDARVSALEARRVPWPLVAAASGLVSAVVAAVAVVVQ